MHDSSVVLSVSEVVDQRELNIQYTVANNLDVPIFVFDKLWNRGLNALDAESAYRYVIGSTLRFLLGPAPVPLGVQVHVRNIPCVSRIEPFRVRQAALKIPLPTKEYSAYFDGDKDYVPTHVHNYELFVAYRRGRDVETAAVRGVPDALKVLGPVTAQNTFMLRSGARPVHLEVLSNPHEHFARLRLPEER